MSSTQTNEVFDVFSNFATDTSLENEGKWVTIGKGANGKPARVKVARTGNDRYNEEFKRLVEKHQVDLNDGGPGADQIATEILLSVQAKTILVDWDGIGFQGKEVPYSVSQAKTLLGVKDFRKRITAIADSFENYRVQAEEQLGNA